MKTPTQGMKPHLNLSVTMALASSLIATACASYQPMTDNAMPKAMTAPVPATIQVPAGNKMVLETLHTGEIKYQCRIKAGTDNQAAWLFIGPDARILKRDGNNSNKDIGRYYGPPATWEGTDGAKVVGMQVSVAPNGAANIPLQLVKITTSTGAGELAGTTFVQRLNTKGGVAPSGPCTVASLNNTVFVPYQSDYIFWKAN